MKQKISLAYSPDTDDAFMVHALKTRQIDWRDYEFSFVSKDIQKLNEEAATLTYDITAISVAAYPDIATNYWLMPIGASIGDGFGPVVVTKPNSSIETLGDLATKKIAVPGLKTSAFFALKTLLPEFEAVPMPFFAIEEAIKAGQVDAGVLIHERQLNFSQFGLRLVSDLGELWHQRYDLPLPLGANAIARRLGEKTVLELTQIYLESIEWALAHRHSTLETASAQALLGLSDQAMAERYISRYVNHRSLSLDEDVLKAMDILFKSGFSHGLAPALPSRDKYICEGGF